MKIDKLVRGFRYNGVRLTDPNRDFSLNQVRDFYANVYPEIISADIEGPEQIGAEQIYTFRKAVGTKGGMNAAQLDRLDGIATNLIEHGWNDTGVLSTGEKIYVLLAASRADLLAARGDTVPEAIARLDADDVNSLVERWRYFHYVPNQKKDTRK
jgi:PRTRC genetic system protein C